MRMHVLWCAVIALVPCTTADAQQHAISSAYGRLGTTGFVELSRPAGYPVEATFNARTAPLALFDVNDAIPLQASRYGHARPTRLPTANTQASAVTFQASRPNTQNSFAGPKLLTGTVSNYRVAQHAMPAYEAAYDVGQKDDSVKCDAGCKGKCSCGPPWAHRSSVFGEFMYLRPRDSEVAFALPVNGAIPVGPVGVLDQDYTSGFRAGFSHCLDECTSLVATYSHFESNTFNFVDTNPTPALRALLLHPATANAGSDFLTASANYDIDFELVDADYRSVLFAGDCYAVNYSIGARFAHLDQDLRAEYTNAGTTETVVTDIDFDGAGIRLGLDMERHTNHHGFLCYGKAFASFVGGEFRADYDHFTTTDPSVVDTAWRAGRVVTMLDLELGVGWQSPCGHYRLTTGYVFSAWLNTITTDNWIESVRNNNFVGLGDRMSFDGLTARAEYRF